MNVQSIYIYIHTHTHIYICYTQAYIRHRPKFVRPEFVQATSVMGGGGVVKTHTRMPKEREGVAGQGGHVGGHLPQKIGVVSAVN
jgi:hypothetical protein